MPAAARDPGTVAVVMTPDDLLRNQRWVNETVATYFEPDQDGDAQQVAAAVIEHLGGVAWVAASMLAAGDLVSYEVQVRNGNHTRLLFFSGVPHPVQLLVAVAAVAADGATVHVTRRRTDLTLVDSATWPFGMAEAVELTGPGPAAGVAAPTSQ